MNFAIYYCHACGNRLQKDETEVSLARGESFSTACCEKCAKAGKRIQDPQAVEKAKLEVKPSTISPDNPIPSDSSEISSINLPVAAPARQTPPKGVRTPATTIMKRPAPSGVDRRNEKKGSGSIVVPVAGAAIVIVGVFIFLATRQDKPETIATEKSTTPAAITEQKPAPIANVDLVPPSTSVTAPAPQPVSTTATAVQPSGGDPGAEFSTEMAEAHIRYKNFVRAKETLDTLEKSLPKDEKYNAVREKIPSVREDCTKKSQAALEEMLKNADAKAQAGDSNGVKAVLNPQRLQDLLPEHASEAQKSIDKYIAQAQAAAKAEEERKQAELAAMRAAFEAKLPADGSLAAPPENAIVMFAPGNVKNIKAGKDSLQSPAGKLPYLDGSKKLEFGNAGGMLYSASILIEYSSAEPLQCSIGVNVKDGGWLWGSITLAAGDMKSETIKLTKDFVTKGKKGDWTGRAISDVKLEPKNPKSGTFGIYRISILK